MRVFLAIFLISWCIFQSSDLAAQSVAGGDITWTNVGKDSFMVTLTKITSCYEAYPGNLTVNAKCASTGVLIASKTITMPSPIDITNVCATQCSKCSLPTCSYPYAYRMYKYKALFVLTSAGSCCEVIFSHESGKRPSTITTGTASSNYFIQSKVNRCLAPKDNSPQFTQTPLILSCFNRDYYINFGASDPDWQKGINDSLVYEFTSPLTSGAVPVTYSGSYTYDKPVYFWGFPNTALASPRGLRLNTTSGDIAFRPMKEEQTVFAIKIKVYRSGSLIAEVARECLLVVLNCTSNYSPSISGTSWKEVCENEEVSFDFTSADADVNDNLKFDWGQQLSGAVFTNNNGAVKKPTANLKWKPASGSGGATHLFTIALKDDKCPVSGEQIKGIQVKVKPNAYGKVIVTDSGCGKYSFEVKNITGSPTSIIWAGDDKLSSSESTFIHQYYKPGIYKYSLSLSAPNGCKYIYSDSINVVKARPVVLAGKDDTICFKDEKILLSGSPSSPAGIWFGTGVVFTSNKYYFDPSSIDVIKNQFYNVVYKYTDPNGCTNTDTAKFYVLETAKPSAGIIPDICIDNVPIILKGTPAGGRWLGPGVYLNKFDPSLGKGSYKLIYEYGINGRCPNYDTTSVNVLPLPIINFSATPFNGNVPLTVQFIDSSTIESGSIVSNSWNFGDGNIIENKNTVSHTYTQNGEFSVVLICTSDKGCDNFMIKPAMVSVWKVSIPEVSDKDVLVSPNPFCNFLEIQTKDKYNLNGFIISNLTGRLIKSEINLETDKLIINTQDLPQNIYLLKLTFDNKPPVQLIIVKSGEE